MKNAIGCSRWPIVLVASRSWLGARAWCWLAPKDSITKPWREKCVPRWAWWANGAPAFGKHAPRTNPLEHARLSQSERAQPHDDQPHLARVRLATPPERHFQTVARPLAHRESTRHCGPVYEPARSCPGLVRRREDPDSGARPHATLATFTAGATRAPHPRLQTPRDDLAVRCPGVENQPGDRATQAPPSRGGISPVPRCDRGASARRTGCAYHCGQLRNPQKRPHPEMVREAPTVSCPLHPYLRFLDQSGGAMVRRTHEQAHSTWRVPQRKRPGSGHSPIHRGAQRTSQALRLDQNGGPNPGQHRSLRTAHHRRASL